MIIAGTGHRPPALFKDNFYSDENRNKLIDFATKQLDFLYFKLGGIIKVIAGGAQGWDQALAEAAINLNIPLLSALPFKGMDSKWPQESKDNLQKILDKSTEVVYVCDGNYANWKFYERDKYMVDNCGLLFALYNGNETGGTAITVKYAEKIGKGIHNCWEDWLKNV